MAVVGTRDLAADSGSKELRPKHYSCPVRGHSNWALTLGSEFYVSAGLRLDLA